MTFGTIVATCAIVALTVAIGMVADKRFSIVPRAEILRPRPPGHAAGEAPALAIRTRPGQLARLRATQHCAACRASLAPGGADDVIRFADRTLWVLHFTCPRCDRTRALYVEPTG
ncbi:MAG: hypothetical protein ABI467_21205 [Kofleriaceae bacterium]